MMSNELQKLKTLLGETMQSWIDENCTTDEWAELGCVSNFLGELMTDAAFNILLSQKDLNDYFNKEDMLKS